MVPRVGEPVHAVIDVSYDQLQELEQAEKIERHTQLIDQHFNQLIQTSERRETSPEAVE